MKETDARYSVNKAEGLFQLVIPMWAERTEVKREARVVIYSSFKSVIVHLRNKMRPSHRQRQVPQMRLDLQFVCPPRHRFRRLAIYASAAGNLAGRPLLSHKLEKRVSI
jgi:hypothetical protein